MCLGGARDSLVCIVITTFTLVIFWLQALRMVCQDMFFSRSHDTPTAAGIMGSDATNARAALESAFRVSRTQTERLSIVGELLDVKVNQRTEKVSQITQVFKALR